MTAVEWTSDREAVRDLLATSDPDLAELYAQAINSLSFPQVGLARIVVAAHCLREMFAALPRVLGDPVAARSDVNRPAKELSEAWRAGDLSLSTEDEVPDDALYTVSGVVFRTARSVAVAAAAGSANARELTSLLATGSTEAVDEAAIGHLHQAIGFFRSWAHLRDYSTADRALPAIDRIERELHLVEDALLTRLGNMADTARTMRELIARANSRATEESL